MHHTRSWTNRNPTKKKVRRRLNPRRKGLIKPSDGGGVNKPRPTKELKTNTSNLTGFVVLGATFFER